MLASDTACEPYVKELSMKPIYLAVPLLTLSACAAIHRSEAGDSEVLLRQAGFQARAADSAESRQALATLPARQIVARNEAGAKTYAFADPDKCRCLYVGDEKEYATLQQLRQQRIAEHNFYAQRSSFEGGVSDLWGPWEPEGLQVK
jgi:hypothetical protein